MSPTCCCCSLFKLQLQIRKEGKEQNNEEGETGRAKTQSSRRYKTHEEGASHERVPFIPCLFLRGKNKKGNCERHRPKLLGSFPPSLHLLPPPSTILSPAHFSKFPVPIPSLSIISSLSPIVTTLTKTTLQHSSPPLYKHHNERRRKGPQQPRGR